MKTQIKIDPITNNFLDRQFRNLLLPIQCLQHLFFVSTFSIEYNCIRPHRILYHIFSFIGTLGFISFHVSNFLTSNSDGQINPFLVIFIRLNVIMLVIPFICFYFAKIIQRTEHIIVILKIQKAFRIINYKKYKKSTMKTWNGVSRHLVSYIITVALIRNLVIAIYFYSLIYFDVNLTYGVFYIVLIRDGMIAWISEVEYYSKLSLELEEAKISEKCKRLFEAYVSLLEAYDIFKKIFKITVLF